MLTKKLLLTLIGIIFSVNSILLTGCASSPPTTADILKQSYQEKENSNYEEAQRLAVQALDRYEESNFVFGVVQSMMMLGDIAYERGDTENAINYYDYLNTYVSESKAKLPTSFVDAIRNARINSYRKEADETGDARIFHDFLIENYPTNWIVYIKQRYDTAKSSGSKKEVEDFISEFPDSSYAVDINYQLIEERYANARKRNTPKSYRTFQDELGEYSRRQYREGYRVGASTANMRSGASTKHNVKSRIDRGTRLSVTRKKGAWNYVVVDDAIHGWMHDSTLVVVNDSQRVSRVTAMRTHVDGFFKQKEYDEAIASTDPGLLLNYLNRYPDEKTGKNTSILVEKYRNLNSLHGYVEAFKLTDQQSDIRQAMTLAESTDDKALVESALIGFLFNRHGKALFDVLLKVSGEALSSTDSGGVNLLISQVNLSQTDIQRNAMVRLRTDRLPMKVQFGQYRVRARFTLHQTANITLTMPIIGNITQQAKDRSHVDIDFILAPSNSYTSEKSVNLGRAVNFSGGAFGYRLLSQEITGLEVTHDIVSIN